MLKKADQSLMDILSLEARNSERKRAHHNFHESLEDSTNRLLIAAEPQTYIRVHRHLADNKWELFFILRGAVSVLIFDDEGKVTDRIELSENSGCRAVELSPDTWHNFVSLTENTVVMEVKPGPYQRPAPEDFATWSPAEGEAKCSEFLKRYKEAKINDILV